MKRALIPFAAMLAMSGCGGGSGGQGSGPIPVEHTFAAIPVLESLQFPSSLRFAPDGRLFFAELNTGHIRVVENSVLRPTSFATLPVSTAGEQGLLGLAIDPQFATNHYLYACYSDSDLGRNRVVRFDASTNVGTARTTIVDGLPIAGNHNGGRLAFGPDGKLYVTIGDTGDPENSQNPNVLPGKLLRYNPNGTIPGDNPTPGNPMFAMGLRNSFGLAFQPGTGVPFVSENGPGCDDEVNRIVKGGNYGWRPDQPCGDMDASFLLPLTRYSPTIAPTGIAFSTTDLYGFNGGLLMCSLNDGSLRLLKISGGAVASQRVLLSEIGSGLLDVTQGPDGTMYLAGTNAIYRLAIAD